MISFLIFELKSKDRVNYVGYFNLKSTWVILRINQVTFKARQFVFFIIIFLFFKNYLKLKMSLCDGCFT